MCERIESVVKKISHRYHRSRELPNTTLVFPVINLSLSNEAVFDDCSRSLMNLLLRCVAMLNRRQRVNPFIYEDHRSVMAQKVMNVLVALDEFQEENEDLDEVHSRRLVSILMIRSG